MLEQTFKHRKQTRHTYWLISCSTFNIFQSSLRYINDMVQICNFFHLLLHFEISDADISHSLLWNIIIFQELWHKVKRYDVPSKYLRDNHFFQMGKFHKDCALSPAWLAMMQHPRTYFKVKNFTISYLHADFWNFLSKKLGKVGKFAYQQFPMECVSPLLVTSANIGSGTFS